MDEVPAWVKVIFSIVALAVGKLIMPVVKEISPFQLGFIGEYLVGVIAALLIVLFVCFLLVLIAGDSKDEERAKTLPVRRPKKKAPQKNYNDPWDTPDEKLPWEK